MYQDSPLQRTYVFQLRDATEYGCRTYRHIGQPWSTHRTLPHVAAEHHATGNNLPMPRYAIRYGRNSPQQKRCDMLIQVGISCMKCLKL